jgi:hypothetical protein
MRGVSICTGSTSGAALPSNVTPEKSHLKDKLERDRLARIFQKGLGEVAGHDVELGLTDHYEIQKAEIRGVNGTESILAPAGLAIDPSSGMRIPLPMTVALAIAAATFGWLLYLLGRQAFHF